MTRMGKIFVVIMLLIVIAAIFLWPTLRMALAGSAHYSEQNISEYDFYTPQLLKDMPRISPHYDFDFNNVSGPEAKIASITFYGVNDINPVNTWLTSIGYTRQSSCDVVADCWRSASHKDVITVIKSDTLNEIKVEVYSSPWQ